MRAKWSVDRLLALRADVAAGLSLVECAARQQGRASSADCDLALWAMTGRTIQQALEQLQPESRNMRPKKITGRDRFELARDAGLPVSAAAAEAGISISFADYVEMLRNRENGRRPLYEPTNNDDALVAALVAAGGYARLSERETREGHVACLPLVQFGARA